MQITKEQARVLACAIYGDITAYVADHAEEYQAWLRENGYSDDKGKMSNGRQFIAS